jgi:hypothetical protein
MKIIPAFLGILIIVFFPFLIVFLSDAMYSLSPNLGMKMETLSTYLFNFINRVMVPFVFATSFLVFTLGMFKVTYTYLRKRIVHPDGVRLIVYAVISFVVMIAVWAGINALTWGGAY